jgi:MFS family permease
MWELYAFWSVLPLLCEPLVQRFNPTAAGAGSGVAWLCFAVIAVGFFGCVLGGVWSRRVGSARVAAWALVGSGLMCVLYPVAGKPAWVAIACLVVLGVLCGGRFAAVFGTVCTVRPGTLVRQCFGFAKRCGVFGDGTEHFVAGSRNAGVRV